MRFALDISIAFRALMQHPHRPVLLGAAIGAVTALLTVRTALAAGLRASALRAATTLSTGHINVGGFFKPTAGQSVPFINDYRPVLESVKKAVPELKLVRQRGRGYAEVVSETGSLQGF